MKKIFAEHYGGFWSERNKKSLYLGLLLIVLSLIIQISAGHYSTRSATSAHFAGDLFLDNLPVVNLDFVIVQGVLLFWIFVWLLLATKPRYLLFSIKAVALFIIFRAFFMSLTHIGIYPRGIILNPTDIGYGFYNLVSFQGNYFFSAHTGFPFLMALIFWNKTFWRRFFLLATVFFGASVLLAHVHYSIDVFAAPFITYGVFVISTKLFPADYALSLHT